ncbi:hypothetical protein DZF79_03185 [Vibrio parahaemolyticus]|nr:hypothetical protein [Vibrio parahaemolyticus]
MQTIAAITNSMIGIAGPKAVNEKILIAIQAAIIKMPAQIPTILAASFLQRSIKADIFAFTAFLLEVVFSFILLNICFLQLTIENIK